MTLNFLVMGVVGVRLGRLQRPLRHPAGRAHRIGAAGPGAGARQPPTSLPAFQLDLWGPGRRCRRSVLCADDRRRHRLVRHQSRPGGVTGLGRHGRGADDRLAVRGVAAHRHRLAQRHADHRPSGRCSAHPGVPVGPKRSGRSRYAGRVRAPRRGREGDMSLGQAFRTPQFAVLATTFFLCCAAHSGPIFHMISYAMSCGIPTMAAVSDLQRRGRLRARRPAAARRARRPPRRQAGAGRRPAGAGGGDHGLSARPSPRPVLCAWRWSSAPPMAG